MSKRCNPNEDEFEFDFDEGYDEEGGVADAEVAMEIAKVIRKEVLPLVCDNKQKESLKEYLDYTANDGDNVIYEHGEYGLGNFPENKAILRAFQKAGWKVGTFQESGPYGVTRIKFKKKDMVIFTYEY